MTKTSENSSTDNNRTPPDKRRNRGPKIPVTTTIYKETHPRDRPFGAAFTNPNVLNQVIAPNYVTTSADPYTPTTVNLNASKAINEWLKANTIPLVQPKEEFVDVTVVAVKPAKQAAINAQVLPMIDLEYFKNLEVEMHAAIKRIDGLCHDIIQIAQTHVMFASTLELMRRTINCKSETTKVTEMIEDMNLRFATLHAEVKRDMDTHWQISTEMVAKVEAMALNAKFAEARLAIASTKPPASLVKTQVNETEEKKQ